MTEVSPDRQRLRIVSGRPTPEETAAVVVVLNAVSSPPASSPAVDRPAPSQWAARSRFMRPAVTPGPDAWRASARPR
ncbi:MAG TPA: acyl-CoA carboxylase epsilon subunit [Streptosporangiaceae bacterium]|nr:acyl-CoA carboxylase epsilon subunit [Streptosporangiaceae bacterium]